MDTEKTKGILIYGMLSLIIIILFSSLFYGSNTKQVTGKAFFFQERVNKIKSPIVIYQSKPKNNFFLDFFRKTSTLINFKPKTEPTIISRKPNLIKNSINISENLDSSNISIGDSDHGISPFKYGICRDNERILKDHCDLQNPKILKETYMTNQTNATICVETSVFCRFGCDNGICLNGTVQPHVIKLEINDKAKKIINPN